MDGDIVTLSIGESKPKSVKLFAELIKLVERTDHTHSFVSWKDTRLVIRKVAEAKGGGCRILTNSQFKNDAQVVRIYQYKISKENLMLAEKFLWDQLAKPYGFKHILGLLLMRACFLKSNPFKDGDYSQICVELSVKMICLALGIKIPDNVENWGLREAQMFNKKNADEGLCEIASQEKIDRINGR